MLDVEESAIQELCAPTAESIDDVSKLGETAETRAANES